MGSVAPESTDSSSTGSVAPSDASLSARETTESKTPIGSSAVTVAPLAPAPIGSTAATIDSGTCAPWLSGYTSSSSAAATTACPAHDSTAESSGSGTATNAALLPFIPPGLASGEATIPRVGINGFGRIGRLVARLNLHGKDNDPFVSAADMTISLKDMPPGLFPDIKVLDIPDPEKIPWAKVGGDYVVESIDTGTASTRLKGCTKKFVIYALSIDAPTFVYGVNENTYTPDIDIISIADCATICIALIAKALNSGFPDLVGKFHVMGHHDPRVDLSCVEMTVKLDKCANYEMIKNSVRMESAVKELCTLLANLEGGAALMALDYLGDCRSFFFDADAEVTVGDSSFKLFAWFNHERSYGQRCTDMILHMAQSPLLPEDYYNSLRKKLGIAEYGSKITKQQKQQRSARIGQYPSDACQMVKKKHCAKKTGMMAPDDRQPAAVSSFRLKERFQAAANNTADGLNKIGAWIGLVARNPRKFTWKHVMGLPVVQFHDQGSCTLSATTMCIEAQHRLVVEALHGRGTFPCKARVPPKYLRLACEKRKVWHPAKGGFTEDVLNVIDELGGLPTQKTKATKGIVLRISRWATYRLNDPDFTEEVAASLIYKKGPMIGVLWADDAYDDFVGKSVYRGIPKSERYTTSGTNRGRHAVVCYRYRYRGRRLLIRIMDSYTDEGPCRWIDFHAFDYFILPVVDKAVELVK